MRCCRPSSPFAWRLVAHLRLPGIQRPPLRHQAADQTEQGGHQTDPRTAPHGAAVPARDRRRAVDQKAQPDHPGLGRLLPDPGLQRRVQPAGPLPVDAHLQVGQVQPTRTSRRPGSWPGTSARSTSPGGDRWVFGDRDSGAYLPKFAWTRIVRHQMVKGAASPDDPALADYWADGDARDTPADQHDRPAAAESQGGRCPLCGDFLLHVEDRPQSPARVGTVGGSPARRSSTITARPAGTPDEPAATRLIHAHCRRLTTGGRTDPALLPAREPPGLA